MYIQLILLLVLIICLTIVVFIYYTKYSEKEWKVYQVQQNYDASKPSETLYAPFDKLFESTPNIADAKLIIFTDYGDIDNNIDKILYPKNSLVYAIKGSDQMASKSYMASYFQKANLSFYIPNTIILTDNSDFNLEKNRIYFLKKNIQRQEGNLITTDVDYIKTQAAKDGYVVCQELLQNPFLVNKRKINLRVYMLIVSKNQKMDFYIYNDGFMYYTPKYFEKNSVERDTNITTGYIDRQVYIDNPLTHKDFYKFLGHTDANKLKTNMNRLFENVKKIYTPTLTDLNKTAENIRFNIFGVDVAPDDQLNVTIMEINKSPDLSYKDERDKNVKLVMANDMIHGIKTGDFKNFIRL